MILVTGATGHLGKATIDFLLKNNVHADQIAALIRDETKSEGLKNKGIELRRGDYNDYDSLRKAFSGVEKILLISSNDVSERTKQHINVIDAAKEAGVKHITYTSVHRMETIPTAIPSVTQSHLDTEDYLKSSGLTYTILRNTLYADLLPVFIGGTFAQDGLNVPAGNGKVPFVTREEMAEAAAIILAGNGHANKEYAIASDVLYSFSDIAGILTEITGQTVKYKDVSSELFVEQHAIEGLPREVAAFFAQFAEAIKQGEFNTDNSDMTTITGRKPASLKEFLQPIYSY